MRQTIVRRALAAAALAATLALAGPAEAAGWRGEGPDLFERVWSWITAWVAPAGGGPAVTKDGRCIDPNGGGPRCSGTTTIPDPSGPTSGR